MDENQPSTKNDVFLQLYNFDFKGLPKFVDGWKKIREISREDISDSYVKAQVFFYSRHVEPVDLKEYCKWLKSSNREVVVPVWTGPKSSLLVWVKEVADDMFCSKFEVRDEDTRDITTTMTDSTVNQGVTDKYPANFGELIQMVQQGIKVPGVKELNIEPTDESPTPAKLGRPKKPWET